MTDSELRDQLYFMCGYRPQIMSSLCDTMQRLRQELAEAVKPEHAETQVQTTEPTVKDKMRANRQAFYDGKALPYPSTLTEQYGTPELQV